MKYPKVQANTRSGFLTPRIAVPPAPFPRIGPVVARPTQLGGGSLSLFQRRRHV